MQRVYLTVDLLNDKSYVGQTRRDDPEYLGSGTYLLRAIRKYGKQNFTSCVLRTCATQQEADYWERFFIRFLGTQDPNVGYNILDGGYQVRTFKQLPQEQQDIIRHKQSAAQRERFLNRPETHGLKNKGHSEYTKMKMRAAAIARGSRKHKWSQESQDKQRASARYRMHTDNPMHREEAKVKASVRMKERHKGQSNPSARSLFVQRGVIIQEFPTLKEAAIYFGVSLGTLSGATKLDEWVTYKGLHMMKVKA